MTRQTHLLSLRNLLRIDAATCAAMGAALALGAAPIGEATALPPGLLVGARLALLPVAAFMAWASKSDMAGGAAPRLAVAGNVLWALASIGLLLSGWVAPNGLGTAFVAGQAVAVAILAGLEGAALRHHGPASGRAAA